MNPILKAAAIALVGLLLCRTPIHAETSSLKMRFVYEGKAPARQEIAIRPGLRPGNAPIFSERLLVDPTSNGIQNVIVYVYTGRGRQDLNLAPYKGVKRQLMAANGRFEPHVLLARAGDTLELIDRGPDLHSPNIPFIQNLPRGFLLPPGKPNVIPLAEPEPAPIPVACNIHPWMKAYLVVLDHPFAAISDVNGEILIRDLPANTKLVFRVFHEAGRIEEVKVGGLRTAWNRSRFEVDMAPGVNDLGDFLVPSDTLRK